MSRSIPRTACTEPYDLTSPRTRTASSSDTGLAQRISGAPGNIPNVTTFTVRGPSRGDGPLTTGFRLLLPEGLDLVFLGLAQLAGYLALGALGGLDLLADLVHDLRVGERGDVAGVGEVGGRGDHAAHDLAGPGLRHIGDDPDVLRPGDLADVGFDRLLDLVLDVGRGLDPGLERDVHLDRPAADVVDDRDRRRLGDLADGQRRGLELLGSEPVPGHVDHVVDAAEDPEIAVGRLEGAVSGEVRPVVPVLGLRVPVVLGVVRRDEPLRLAPDRLEDARPRVADADVARLAAALGHLVAVFVENDGVDAERRGAAAARLHLVDAGERRAEEAAGLGLPPGVGDGRLASAAGLVEPAPHLGLDWLADRRHGLEVVVVLGGLVRSHLAQHPDRGGRGVEDVHPKLLGDAPRPAGVRVVRGAFVHDARGAEGERPVDDVGVPGDPADVRHAPVGVVRVDVLVVLGRPGHVRHVTADGVLAALRTACRAGRVHQEQRVRRRQPRRLDDLALVRGQQVVNEDVPPLDHRGLGRVLAGVAAEDENLVDLLALLGRGLDSLVGLDLVVEQVTAAVVAVHRDEHS